MMRACRSALVPVVGWDNCLHLLTSSALVTVAVLASTTGAGADALLTCTVWPLYSTLRASALASFDHPFP